MSEARLTGGLMFTGLVADLGEVIEVEPTGDGARLTVAPSWPPSWPRAIRSPSTASA